MAIELGRWYTRPSGVDVCVWRFQKYDEERYRAYVSFKNGDEYISEVFTTKTRPTEQQAITFIDNWIDEHIINYEPPPPEEESYTETEIVDYLVRKGCLEEGEGIKDLVCTG